MNAKKAKQLRAQAVMFTTNGATTLVENTDMVRIQTTTNPMTGEVHRVRTATMEYPKGSFKNVYRQLKRGRHSEVMINAMRQSVSAQIA